MTIDNYVNELPMKMKNLRLFNVINNIISIPLYIDQFQQLIFTNNSIQLVDNDRMWDETWSFVGFFRSVPHASSVKAREEKTENVS